MDKLIDGMLKIILVTLGMLTLVAVVVTWVGVGWLLVLVLQ